MAQMKVKYNLDQVDWYNIDRYCDLFYMAYMQ